MATQVTPASADRRRAIRWAARDLGGLTEAKLRTGQALALIDLSALGARVEVEARLAPGTRVELQLIGDSRCLVWGRVCRCEVAALPPERRVRYRAALRFESRVAPEAFLAASHDATPCDRVDATPG